jgi:hypothetical protein
MSFWIFEQVQAERLDLGRRGEQRRPFQYVMIGLAIVLAGLVREPQPGSDGDELVYRQRIRPVVQSGAVTCGPDRRCE